jgi:hypothetical protein
VACPLTSFRLPCYFRPCAHLVVCHD